MLFLEKLKQKIFGIKLTNSQKSFLVIFLLVLFFVCLNTFTANAMDVLSTDEQAIVDNYVEKPGFFTNNVIMPLLRGILKFVGFLLSMAETIFQWIVNPVNMLKVMDNQIIYSTWAVVRDVFNVVFIMVLLFSAFATIFQASANYNYKKILLNLVIMALLVNFSYPIARFIIDASNILMFGLLDGLEGSNSFMQIIKQSKLSNIFAAANKNPDILYLIAAIIFTFIFAITLLVIAVLLVIRTITLTIYIIFSPVAFVGKVMPGTALSSAADDWWKDFMKQCFAGPIMIFMLFIATRMFNAITSIGGDFENIAIQQVPGFSTADPAGKALGDLIASASFFSLPIVILWIGIIQAQKSVIHGANAVVGMGKKAGKWLTRNPAFGTVGYTLRKTGVSGGIQQKWANWRKGGLLGSDRQAEREARIAGSGPFAVANATNQADLKRIKDAKESLNLDGLSEGEVRTIADDNNRSRYERTAAMQKLAEFGSATATDLAFVRGAFTETSHAFTQLANKVKAYDPVAAFAHIQNQGVREARIDAYLTSNQFDAKKLNDRSLGNQEFMQRAFSQRAINAKDLIALRKKGQNYNTAINTTMGNMQATGNYSADTEANRDFQLAYFSQIGEVGNANFANNIFTRIDEETANRMTLNTVQNNRAAIENNIKQGKIKSVVNGMTHNDAAKLLVQNLSDSGPHQNFVRNHPDLANYV